MNDFKIARLLSRRNKLMTRRDGLYDHKIIATIDEQLSKVEPGYNNDVDLALGRSNSVLPERVDYKAGWFVSPAVMLEDADTQALIEKTQRIWNETQSIEY